MLIYIVSYLTVQWSTLVLLLLLQPSSVTLYSSLRRIMSFHTASHCIPWLVVLIIEFLAIAILNIITIVVFVKNKRQLQRRSTYLIIHLAIVDLLVGVVSGPLQIEHRMATFCNLWKYSRERIWSDYLKVGFVNSFSSTSLVHLGTAFWTTGFIRRW